MAGDDGEKTELATPRRLEDLASKGQFPYSRELAGALLLFLIAGALKAGGGPVADALASLFRTFFTLGARHDVTAASVPGLFVRVSAVTFGIAGPLLLLALAIATAAGYLQVGVSMNTERMRWRWERLNPVAGLKRIFSFRSSLPLVLSLAKLAAVGFIAWASIGSIVRRAPDLMLVDVGPLSALITDGALTMSFRVGTFLLFIGLVDVLWQRFTFMKDSMMTKHEVKEETKQAEGDPQMKSRIKQRQREIARAKMIRDVRKATVIIRNPTHFAVALKYERGADAAPRCVAKGRDHIALRIIAEAEKHHVPVVSKPELARELFRVVRVGHAIPEALYKAVAGVLAYVLRRNQQARAGA